MSFHAYILRCGDGSYYAGHTDDLDRRVAEHRSGLIPGHTATRLPVELVWSETFATREEALSAELRIKRWTRAKKEALIGGDWLALKVAAIPPSERVARAEGLQPTLHSVRAERSRSPVPLRPVDDENSVASNPVRTERSRNPIPAQAAEPALRLRSGRTVAEARTVEGAKSNPPPLIILVRPQLGENIGKAARAMLNFGLTELRLVAPRDGWPNPAAGPAASGADQVIEHATVHPDIASATADCAHVYATTVRRRGLVKPVVTPAHAAAQIRDQPGRSAILFGPERSGLETDDLAVARTVLTVPINPDFGSLNLAQAVVIVAYEWSKHAALAQPTDLGVDPPAPQAELDGLIDHAEKLLTPRDYFLPADRAPTNRRTLRSVLTKPGWSSNEVRTMRGVLSCLMRRPS